MSKAVLFPHCNSPLVRGFTLLEILVVLLIMGLILSFATLSIGDGAAGQLRTESERFATLVTLASQEAVMRTQELGIVFQSQGYGFYILHQGNWQELKRDDLLRFRYLPAGVQLELQIEGETVMLSNTPHEPQVWLLSSGECTPFTAKFMVELDNVPSYNVTANLQGLITTQHSEVMQ